MPTFLLWWGEGGVLAGFDASTHFPTPTVLSQSTCYSGITDLQDFPLPVSTRYNAKEQQVIAPHLSFSCLGYLTSWSAHVLVLTRTGFLEFLPHVIQLQVWRPGPANQSYTRVGSNTLRFQGSAFRDSVIPDPTTNETSFYSFTEQVRDSRKL